MPARKRNKQRQNTGRERGKKAGRKAGNLVPQPHGGAIHQGTPTHIVPGPGRPPSVVRTRARDSFYERIPVLETIADDADATNEQRISATDKLGKYAGLAGTLSVDDVRERLRLTIVDIRAMLSADQASLLIARIKPHWTET